YRRQPHEAAVARRVRVVITCDRIAGIEVTVQRGRCRAADVEAAAGAAVAAIFPPADVAVHLVCQVPAVFDQALREAEGHGGIVGPLAGLKTERPASDDIGERSEGARRAEFDGSAESIANGESEQ